MSSNAVALSEILGANRIVGSVIPETTFRRARKAFRKTLSRDHSERLYDMGRVVDSLGRGYDRDQEAISVFLNRRYPLLAGVTPFKYDAFQFGRCVSRSESYSSSWSRYRSLMRPRTLPETMRAFRIGDPAGQFAVWSAESAKRTDGRWHEAGAEMIYASENYSTAML